MFKLVQTFLQERTAWDTQVFMGYPVAGIMLVEH